MTAVVGRCTCAFLHASAYSLLDQVAVSDASVPSTARKGETIAVTSATAERLLGLGAAREWEEGDGEPVPDDLRLPEPRLGPATAAEAPPVNPAPTSDAQQLLDAYEREQARSSSYVPPLRRTPAEARAERARLDAEEDGQRRRLQPWTPEGAVALREHGRAVEARRRVAARRADAEEARQAAEQARLEAEVAAEEARLERLDTR